MQRQSEPYDLLLKGGRILDPANTLDAVMDVAIRGGRVARIAADIPASDAALAQSMTSRPTRRAVNRRVFVIVHGDQPPALNHKVEFG